MEPLTHITKHWGNQSPPHGIMAEPADGPRTERGGLCVLDMVGEAYEKVHDKRTKLTRSRAPCPRCRLCLGISERPWSFTTALGRDGVNRVWQGW